MCRMIPRSIKFWVYLKLKKPAKDFSIWSHCFPAYISFYLLHVHALTKVSLQYIFSHLDVEQIFTNASEKIIWGHHFLQRNTKLRYSLSRSTRRYFSRPTVGRIVFKEQKCTYTSLMLEKMILKQFQSIISKGSDSIINSSNNLVCIIQKYFAIFICYILLFILLFWGKEVMKINNSYVKPKRIV